MIKLTIKLLVAKTKKWYRWDSWHRCDSCRTFFYNTVYNTVIYKLMVPLIVCFFVKSTRNKTFSATNAKKTYCYIK